ncbi:MAG: (5-formylfuran-3-yl)methyl phosphate synthase, partial [Planctomycetaceae bacterium]
APPPDEVIDAALASNCAGVLFDTFRKDGRTLFDELPPESMCRFLQALHKSDALVALAGSLSVREIPTAAALQPDVIAVRTAACEDGRRNGPVTASTVRRLRELFTDGRVETSALSPGR